MLHLTSLSLRELDVLHLLQNLMGCSSLGLFNGRDVSGSWQDHIHPFEGHVHPRNPHLVCKAEVSIGPSVADVYLILGLAKPSCLTHPVQECHRGSYRHLSPLEQRGCGGAFGRVLGGSGSSNCSAETWSGGWRVGQVRTKGGGLGKVEDVAWK